MKRSTPLRMIKVTLVGLLISYGVMAVTPALAQPPSPAPMTLQTQDNRPWLLLFPLGVLGIIGVLLVIKRPK